jgi:cysteine desulfurase
MPIYLDHAATTPMRSEVIAAYTAALGVVGNPSSIHSAGQGARGMLESARETVASALGVDPIQVTFTSGGTESINLALKGLFWGAGRVRTKNRILATRAEHHATIDALEWLERHEGAVIDWIPVDAHGRMDLVALEAAMGEDVALVTTLLANNEVGTVQPVAEIVRIAGEVPVHCDAVGAWGQVPLPPGLAAISVSAHKIGGPVGIGALALARGTTVTPLIHGGNQQAARSGTQDAAGAAAFAAALALPHPDLVPLRDRLIAGVLAGVPDAVLRGDPVERLPGNAHFTFPGCEGDSLLFLLDAAGLSVSTGSACQAGVPEASHVLLAMGLDEPTARGALRFTLGHGSTAADVEALMAALPGAVERARVAGFADRRPDRDQAGTNASGG